MPQIMALPFMFLNLIPQEPPVFWDYVPKNLIGFWDDGDGFFSIRSL